MQTDPSNKEKLHLALAIISGRHKTLVSDSQWYLLGYNPYQFSYYGKPSLDEIKQKAEEIIIDAILEKT